MQVGADRTGVWGCAVWIAFNLGVAHIAMKAVGSNDVEHSRPYARRRVDLCSGRTRDLSFAVGRRTLAISDTSNSHFRVFCLVFVATILLHQ